MAGLVGGGTGCCRPSGWGSVRGEPGCGEASAIVVIWAVFLLAMAWLIGWVSERGGSLSLTQGLGGRAIRAIEDERGGPGQDIHDGIASTPRPLDIEAEVPGQATRDACPGGARAGGAGQADPAACWSPRRGPWPGSSGRRTWVRGVRARTSSGSWTSPGIRTGVPADLSVEGVFPSLERLDAHPASTAPPRRRSRNIELHAEASHAVVWARSGRGGADLHR